MNEPTPRESHWLNERLQRLGSDELEFGVVRSPLRPVVERSDPWQAEMRRHDFSAMLARLLPDDGSDVRDVSATSETGALADRPPVRGRVVAVTDVEEDPVGRVQTAVLLARRLADSGARVLLVDADLRHVGLSRWMPDRDLDAEGLVDVLQYGASVAAVQRKGPIEHVSIVSVGSYRPDGLDLFDDQGLGRLVVQLRASADVVLVVLPAWLAQDRFHPFLVHPDAVVVSMHLDRSLAPALEDLLRYLQGLNVTIAGLVTFSGPDASEKRVDELLRETDPWREPEDVEELEVPKASIDIDPSVTGAHSGATSPYEDTFESDPAAQPRVSVPAVEHAAEPLPRGFRRRSAREAERSSPVLRIALIAAVIALLAFVGWWGLTQRDHPSARTPHVTHVATRSVPPGSAGRGAVTPVATDTTTQDATEQSALLADTAESTLGSGADPRSAAEPEIVPESVPESEPEIVSAIVSEPADDPAPARESAPSVEAPASPTAADPLAGSTAAWQRELGTAVGGGFALHLYSFADSTDALGELPRLQRQGWRTAVRGADVPGKGRWFRVLVGRFDDRASALAARDAVGERAGVDWVGVVRVP